MRVMVTGSREWEERTIVRCELGVLLRPGMAPWDITIVHGAARGADTIAAEMAEGFGYEVEAHPADWQRWGHAAGPIRNREMVESGIDLVLGFKLGVSRGTQHAVDLAVASDLPIILWSAQPGDYPRALRIVRDRALAPSATPCTACGGYGTVPIPLTDLTRPCVACDSTGATPTSRAQGDGS